MKRLVKRSKQLPLKIFVKDILVRVYNDNKSNNNVFINIKIEEFGIYLQYVRKLGFEETPDYDFLRSLFTKAIEKMNETDDGIYDWMLLNNGKGWQVKINE
jgi:hypothetical protein